MTTKVAVWSTGHIGLVAIRALSRRPEFELVGVGVHTPEKVGKDAGTLTGIEPVGVLTTDSIDELIALKPDCIAYAGPSESMNPGVLDAVIRFLEAGINVSTTSVSGVMHPASMDPDKRARIEAAATKGGASIYATGIEPGFAGDHFPLMLTTMSESIKSIRVQEIFRYDGYPGTAMMKQGMGFDMPMDFQPHLSVPEVQTSIWGHSLHKVAEQLGTKLDEVRCTYDKQLTPRTLEVACGTIREGTVGAIRFETIGVIDGRDAIVIEHVNRMADDLAPDWPVAERNGTYRVIIKGSPNFTCDMVVGTPDTGSVEGRVAAGMLMVNAIPYLCDAPPGIVTSVDIPFNTPRNVFV